MKTCRRGHVKEPGRRSCRFCQRIAQKRYRATAKGAATHRRYVTSPKGRANVHAERRRFHIRHRERRAANHAKWVEANREKRLAYQRAYFARIKAQYGNIRAAFWARQEMEAL